MHTETSTQTPPVPTATPYDLIGGEARLRQLVNRFYDIMDSEPAAADIRAMHGPNLGPVRESLFGFLSGWLGGPRLYTRCIMSAHRPFSIGAAERDQWLLCMKCAVADLEIAPDLRRLLDQAFLRMADAIRNR
jgi:hemoglobin